MPDELDGQIWPEREWFFYFEFKEKEESATKETGFVMTATTADEALEKARKHIKTLAPKLVWAVPKSMNRV